MERDLPPDAVLERQGLQKIAAWAQDAKLVHAELNAHAQRFDTLLARALRQRNAVVHGRQTLPAVVLSVDWFIGRLAAYVVAQAIHGVAVGEDPADGLEHHRERSRRIFWRLERGHEQAHWVLFGEDELAG